MLEFQGRRWFAAALTTLVVAPGCGGSSPPASLSGPSFDSSTAAVASTEAASPASILQGDVRFLSGFEAGEAESHRTGKPMLVFFTADWCSYCEELVEESFRHPAVATLSQRFVCTLIDADVEKDVCQRFGVASYPTIQFLSPAGVPLNRMTGKKAPRQVAIEMQTALQAVARRLNSPVESLTR